MKKLDYRSRRWTVIASGLLCGALAMVVLFTNRGAFFSPLAVVVMGAVGLAAVLLHRVDTVGAVILMLIVGCILSLIAILETTARRKINQP